MADDEDVWRLPGGIRGQDVRLGNGDKPKASLSPSAKARLRRIANKTPEAMVKLTGRSRGGAGHLKAHLDYITRNGKIQAETQDGERITDRERLRDLHDDWMMTNAAEQLGRPRPNEAQSVGLILSMPPGSPADRVEAAARTWARDTLGGKYDWLMARHDDTGHPHVHITVRAVGYDDKRLAPGPANLQQWRERFAAELRRLGVEAEATPRQARGIIHKVPASPIQRTVLRSAEPRVRKAEKREAQQDASSPAPPQPPGWSRDIQLRQELIRRAYLGHADELAQGDNADRQLARDIRRFVADMPVPLTRRQAMAVELRRVLEQRSDRVAPLASRAESPSHGLHRANPSRSEQEPPAPAPTIPKGRG